MATFFFSAAAGVFLAFVLAVVAPPAAASDNTRWLEKTYRAFALAVRGAHSPAAKQLAAIGESRGDPAYLREAAKEALLAGDAEAAAHYGKRRIVLGGGDEARLDYAGILLYARKWEKAEREMSALLDDGLLDDAGLFDRLRLFGGANASDIGGRLFSAKGRDYLARLAIKSGDWQLARQAADEGMTNNSGRAVWHFLSARAAEGEDGIKAALVKLDDYIAAGCPGVSDRRACDESIVLLTYQRLATSQEWDAPLRQPAAFSQQAAYSAGAFLENAGALERAAVQFGRYDDLYSRLGIARLRLAEGNKMEAITIIDAAKIKNNNEFSLRERSAAVIAGLLYGKQKRLQRLIAARQTAPDDYFLLYEHALAAEENGDIDTAVSLLRRLAELYPGDAHVLNALGYVLADHHLHLAEAQKHIQSALDISRRRANVSADGFAAHRPAFVDDANILDSLGWVHYRLGNLPEAKLWLGKAAGLSGAAEIAAHYGEILWQTGEREKAAEVWRAGLQNDADNTTLKKTLMRFVPDWQ
ncbi:MAG: tetratricopeptide repeat protein [Gammaproteobacteria bacterium]